MDAGCWQGPQLHLSTEIPACGLFMWLLSIVTAWYLGLKGEPHRRENQVGSYITFFDLVLEVTHSHFCSILFIRRELLRPIHNQGEGKNDSPYFDRLKSKNLWMCLKPQQAVT